MQMPILGKMIFIKYIQSKFNIGNFLLNGHIKIIIKRRKEKWQRKNFMGLLA